MMKVMQDEKGRPYKLQVRVSGTEQLTDLVDLVTYAVLGNRKTAQVEIEKCDPAHEGYTLNSPEECGGYLARADATRTREAVWTCAAFVWGGEAVATAFVRARLTDWGHTLEAARKAGK